MSKAVTPRPLDYEAWLAAFNPIRNPFVDGDGPFDGLMFETFGREFEYVAAIADIEAGRVWTLVETESDGFAAIEGMRFVNRIGYFVIHRAEATTRAYQVQLDLGDPPPLEATSP